MNPIGVNTWIWVSPLTDERLRALAPRVKEMGFSVIELPIEDPSDWDAGAAGDLLAELGLGATTCAVMPPTRDLVIDDPAVVASTQAYLRECVRMAARVMHSSTPRTPDPSASSPSPLRTRPSHAPRPSGDRSSEHRTRSPQMAFDISRRRSPAHYATRPESATGRSAG
jgi:sugar phosphate isomerase/epimerase